MTEKLRSLPPEELRKLIAKVHARIDTSGDCWATTLSLNLIGRAQIWHAGKTYFMYHVLLAERGAFIPKGMVADHLCRNPACCNPDHFRITTYKQNLQNSDKTCAVKTHCPKGHAYDTANTYVKRSARGYQNRICRECGRDRCRRWRQCNQIKQPASAGFFVAEGQTAT